MKIIFNINTRYIQVHSIKAPWYTPFFLLFSPFVYLSVCISLVDPTEWLKYMASHVRLFSKLINDQYIFERESDFWYIYVNKNGNIGHWKLRDKSIGRLDLQEVQCTIKQTAKYACCLSAELGVTTADQQGKSNLLPIHSSAVQIKQRTKPVNFHPSPELSKPKYRLKKINNPNRWENIFSL